MISREQAERIAPIYGVDPQFIERVAQFAELLDQGVSRWNAAEQVGLGQCTRSTYRYLRWVELLRPLLAEHARIPVGQGDPIGDEAEDEYRAEQDS